MKPYQTGKQNIPIWGKGQVLTSWLIAGSLLLTFLFTKQGFIGSSLHIVAVSLLAVGVLTRFIWGFYGSPTSLLKNMLYKPGAILSHLYNISSSHRESFQGHSPLGGLIAFITLLLAGLTAITGLMIVDGAAGKGSWIAQTLGFTQDTTLLSFHTQILSLTVFLWSAHSIGVLWRLLERGTPLISFLFTGHEIVYLQKEEEAVSITAKNPSAGLSTAALAICLAIILILPVFSEMGGTSFSDQTSPALSPSTLVAESPIIDQQVEANELAKLETAAGDQTDHQQNSGQLPQEESKIYHLPRNDITIPFPIVTE